MVSASSIPKYLTVHSDFFLIWLFYSFIIIIFIIVVVVMVVVVVVVQFSFRFLSILHQIFATFG